MPGARRIAGVGVTGIVAALVLVGFLTVPSAVAAFMASISNSGNNVAAGNVIISDDDTGAALFTVGAPSLGQVSGAGLRPGQSVSNCVRVTYSGSLPAQVRLYVSDRSDTAPNGARLSDSLHVGVEEATAGSFGCTGFKLPAPIWDATHPAAQQDWLPTFPTTYSAGVPSGPAAWPTGTTRVYKITFTLDAAAADTVSASTTTVSFRWEARSAAANLAANRPATGSPPCATTEAADKAFNGSYTAGWGDKFCSGTAPNAFLQTDLGRNVLIDRFVIRHSGAGGETTDWNLRAFQIMLSTDGSTWTTVVDVTDNAASVSTHSITPTLGRYVKLVVSQAAQTGVNATRVYEFEIYGP